MKKEFFDIDTSGRKLIHGIEPPSPQYHEWPFEKTFPTEEDIACEAQLAGLGVFEMLKFEIKNWNENEKRLEELNWWRPFQPKPGKANDRESILVYGNENSKPTDPCGLAQMAANTGVKPTENSMTTPTDAVKELTCLHEVFSLFDLGRTFLVRLNEGGHYPPHRDHVLLTRPTFRLIAFLGNSINTLRWEVEDRMIHFEPNRVYYVDTRKMHKLWSAAPHSTMCVFNVIKNWENTMKVVSSLKFN